MAYKYKFGIDFGTTNSSIALRYDADKKGVMNTILFDVDTHSKIQTLLRSLVYIDENGKKSVGINAIYDSTEAKDNINYSLIREIKLELDNKKEDVDIIRMANTSYKISDIIAIILRTLKKMVGAVPVTVDGVVFGVPVDYNDKSKQIMIEAAYKAGFYSSLDEAIKKTEFVSEPIAVALDYAVDLRKQKNIFVLDFGGGTLDTSIMKLSVQNNNEVFKPHEAIAKQRCNLGGEEFTKDFFKNGFLKKHGLCNFLDEFYISGDLDEDDIWNYLKTNKYGVKFIEELDRVKCELSFREKESLRYVDYNENGQAIIISESLTREDFEDSIDNHFTEIKDVIAKCLDDANNKKNMLKNDIDIVLLAGGSSIIPSVINLAYDVFGEKKVVKPRNNQQLTSIVKGLAAAGLKEDYQDLYDDIVDCSYGIWDVKNHNIATIIERGTKVSDTDFDKLSMDGGIFKEFLAVGNATPIVKIYQDNNELGEFMLPKRGSGDYKIYFKVNREKGWLNIYVFDNGLFRWLDATEDMNGNESTFFINLD